MEPASSSGKLVNNQQHTRRHITEDAKLKYKMFTRKYNSIHSNYYDLLNVTDVPNIYALPYIVNIFYRNVDCMSSHVLNLSLSHLTTWNFSLFTIQQSHTLIP